MPLQPIANASDDHDGTDLRWNWMQNCRWAVWALARVLLANAAGRDAHATWSFGRVRRPRGAMPAVREARRTRKGDGRLVACRAMPAAMAMAEKLKHHCVSWGFHFVRAPIELEGHRSVKLLLIWASFSTEWAANSWN